MTKPKSSQPARRTDEQPHRGGSFIRENGKLKRVEGTKPDTVDDTRTDTKVEPKGDDASKDEGK